MAGHLFGILLPLVDIERFKHHHAACTRSQFAAMCLHHWRCPGATTTEPCATNRSLHSVRLRPMQCRSRGFGQPGTKKGLEKKMPLFTSRHTDISDAHQAETRNRKQETCQQTKQNALIDLPDSARITRHPPTVALFQIRPESPRRATAPPLQFSQMRGPFGCGHLMFRGPGHQACIL